MALVLFSVRSLALARYGARPVAALLVVYMWVAVPISGFGMNPARSLASAVLARSYASLWLYLLAPPLGMLLAVRCYRVVYGRRRWLDALVVRPVPNALP